MEGGEGRFGLKGEIKTENIKLFNKRIICFI